MAKENEEIFYEFTDEINFSVPVDQAQKNANMTTISLIEEVKKDPTKRSTSEYMRDVQEQILDEVPILNNSAQSRTEKPSKETTISYKNQTYRVAWRRKITDDDLTVIDKDWVSSRFMTPGKNLSDLDQRNRFFSAASWKVTSTSLGNSMAINPRPQFTRFADIKGPNRTNITLQKGISLVSKTRGINLGLGRYYSEAIDDNVEQIFMEFGVPKFNNLISYFTRAVDYVDQYIANHGTLPYGYYLGKTVGTIARWCAFPLVSLIVLAGSTAFKIFAGSNPLSYYYMSPRMNSYWAAVNLIVNQMCTELGMINSLLAENESNTARKMGVPLMPDEESIKELGQLLPGLISPSSKYIDIFYIIAKPQSIALRLFQQEYEAHKKSDGTRSTDFVGYVKKMGDKREQGAPSDSITNKLDYYLSFQTFLDKFGKNTSWFGEEADLTAAREKNAVFNGGAKDNNTLDLSKITDTSGDGSSSVKYAKNGDGSDTLSDGEIGYFDKMAKVMDSVIRDGLGYAIFNVDYTGAVSDSVNNSTTDIPTGTSVRELAKTARHAKFSLAGGNIAGDLIAQGIDAVKNVAAGLLDGVTFGLSNVIQTIMGGGYVTMPKMWDDSSIDLASVTYSMDLVSPYGNIYSQLQNIYIPLAMIIAGSFPLKAGENSYTSPFLCSIFNKGKQNIKLGMITSVTIERGTGNLGYTRNKRPLGFKVSFTVSDLAPVLTAPINQSIFQEVFSVFNFDDNDFGRYLGTLCSRDFYSNKYMKPKMIRKFNNALLALSQGVSAGNLGAHVGDFLYPVLSPWVSAKHLDTNQLNGGSSTGGGGVGDRK